MRLKKEEMEKVLSKDLEVSPVVEQKIQETYKQISEGGRARSKFYKTSRKVAAAAAVIFVLSGSTALAAYASGNTEFLKNIFGNESLISNPVTTVQVEDCNGETFNVIVPAKEYVPMDADTLKNVEPYVQNIGKTFMIGEHKFTVLNHISDGNTGVISYKLECEKGIDILEGDKNTNRDKGAWFSDKGTGYFSIEGADGRCLPDKIFIDTEKSTDTCYYLYESYVGAGDTGAEKICISQFDTSREEANKNNKDVEIVDEERIDIKVNQVVSDQISIMDGENKVSQISSLGMSLDLKYMQEFKDLAEKQHFVDPNEVRTIVLNYKDGSKYVVFDVDNTINNTNYECGGMGESHCVFNIAFNRMIDTNKVKNIEVNGKVIEP